MWLVEAMGVDAFRAAIEARMGQALQREVRELMVRWLWVLVTVRLLLFGKDADMCGLGSRAAVTSAGQRGMHSVIYSGQPAPAASCKRTIGYVCAGACGI
jgi:hypothetical protein